VTENSLSYQQGLSSSAIFENKITWRIGTSADAPDALTA
jgi:hypothetical protein